MYDRFEILIRVVTHARCASLLAALTIALAVHPAVAQNVGNVGAVNPTSVGTPPRAVARNLMIGATVVSNEHIQTTGEGTAQISFLDKTTLAIGRNSSVTIDKFVYDPQAGRGEMAASMAKGVMRFVGGQISHTSGAEITTPVATIGVRGGMMTIIFLPGGHVMIIDHFGHIDVANGVSAQVLLRPGFAVQVNGQNEPIGPPFPAPPDILSKAFVLLASHHGQHGGATEPPNDLWAAQFGLGGDRLPNDPATSPGLDTVETVNMGQTFVGNRSQQLQWNGGHRPPKRHPS